MKKILKKENEPFAILFIVYVIIHIFIVPNFNDDATFAKYAWSEIPERMRWLSENWSTRIIIENIHYRLYPLPNWVWKILDSLIMCLMAYSISALFGGKGSRERNSRICCLVLMYPLMHMMTAGWIATTANYTWPMALGLYALVPVKAHYEGKKIPFYCYPLYLMSLLYASNEEQMACILFGGLLLILVYDFYIKKKVYLYHILQMAITAGMLIYKISSPINEIVTRGGAAKFNKTFFTLNIVDKMYLGFSTTMDHYIGNTDLVFLILLLSIFLVISIKEKKMFYKIISALPVILVSAITFLRPITSQFMPALKTTPFFMETTIDLTNFMQMSKYAPLFLEIMICGLICIGIYIIWGNTLKTVLYIYIFGIAIAARMVLGFSASLYASVTRTWAFTYFLFIIIASAILDELYDNKELASASSAKTVMIKKSMSLIMILGAGLSVFNLLLSI